MSRARILADYVSSGDELADKAPLASPDFTGTVDLTGTTVSLDDDEISLDKVNGGTLGTGTIGGSSVVNTSGAITTTGTFTSPSITDNNTDVSISAIEDITHQTTNNNVTAGHHIFKSYNTEIMRIDGGTNRVGIGVTNPATKLSIRVENATAASSPIRLYNADPTGGTGTGAAIQLAYDADLAANSVEIAGVYNGGPEMRFKTGSSNTERMRISAADGDVKVMTGNLVIGTAGKGVMFHPHDAAVSTPGSDSNLLDDYEEGTFTPTVVRSGMTIGTYSTQTGVYRKIGSQVTVFINLANSNCSGGSGTYTCGGFPFPNNLGIAAQSAMGRNYMSGDTNDRDFRLPNGESAPRLYRTSADLYYQTTQTYLIWEFRITYTTTA